MNSPHHLILAEFSILDLFLLLKNQCRINAKEKYLPISEFEQNLDF